MNASTLLTIEENILQIFEFFFHSRELTLFLILVTSVKYFSSISDATKVVTARAQSNFTLMAFYFKGLVFGLRFYGVLDKLHSYVH